MRRKVIEIVVQVLSHSAVFALAATMTGGALVSAAFTRAAQSPAYRVGVRLERSSPDPNAGFPSLDEDLRALDALYVAPSGDVTRLLLLLEERKLAEAAVVCSRLGWPRCDPKALGEMREMVAR